MTSPENVFSSDFLVWVSAGNAKILLFQEGINDEFLGKFLIFKARERAFLAFLTKNALNLFLKNTLLDIRSFRFNSFAFVSFSDIK